MPLEIKDTWLEIEFLELGFSLLTDCKEPRGDQFVMDTAPSDWYTEELAGIDCYEVIDQYHLESLPIHDDYHQFSTAAPQDLLERSISPESYSCYYPTSLSTQQTIDTPAAITTMHISPERLRAFHKTNNWTADFQLFAEASSSPTSKILSFETSSVYAPADSQMLYENQLQDCPAQEAKKLETKRPYSMTATNPSYGQDHIIAERKRREKLNQRFVALSSIVPGLTKMDKASILGDAINYVKKLQERVEVLEEQTKKRTVESVILLKKSQLSSDGESSDQSDLSSDRWSDSVLPEVEARSSDKDVLIRIHFKKQPGIVVKILNEIENLHLSIVNSTILPFGVSILDMTIIAKMDHDFSMSMKDMVNNLRLAFLKYT